MRKYNVFYDESGGGLTDSVLYDTAALSIAISGMNTAYGEVSSIFTELAQNSFFSDGSWECEAASNAKSNFDTINGYCNNISTAYKTYTDFLQDAVDTDFTDVGTKIVSAISEGNSD